MMSRSNCHASKVSSIVLGKNHTGLIRVFLAWDGHNLAENHLMGNLPIGIHDHRYGLSLRLIHGRVRNTYYERGTGRTLNEWNFITGGMAGSPSLIKIGKAQISATREMWLKKDAWLSMTATQLHNIDCKGMAAWLVAEGAVEQEITSLFTVGSSINTSDLYKPFNSSMEVINHVDEFIRKASENTSPVNN